MTVSLTVLVLALAAAAVVTVIGCAVAIRRHTANLEAAAAREEYRLATERAQERNRARMRAATDPRGIRPGEDGRRPIEVRARRIEPGDIETRRWTGPA